MPVPNLALYLYNIIRVGYIVLNYSSRKGCGAEMREQGGRDKEDMLSNSSISYRKEGPHNPGSQSWWTSFRCNWHEYQWLVIIGLWIIVIITGYKGFSDHFRAVGEKIEPSGIFYATLRLFKLAAGDVQGLVGWELNVARFLAPAVVAYTAIAALTSLFYEQYRMFCLRFYQNHIVICGLGQIGFPLAKEYLCDGEKVVVIEKDKSNDKIQQVKDHGAIVLIGDAVDPNMLYKARVHTASRVIAGSGDEGLNAEIIWRVRELTKQREGRPLTCFAHITGRQLFELLKGHPIMKIKGKETFRVCLFNIHTTGAKEMLKHYPPFGFTSKDASTKPIPCVVVIGLGRFGQALVLETAIKWRLVCMERKIKILILDRTAILKHESLLESYPLLAKICDFTIREIDFESGEFKRADFISSGDNPDITAIYVCINDDRLGLTAALTLSSKLKNQEVLIVVRTSQDKGFARLINGVHEDVYPNLHAFELLDRTVKPELLGCFNEGLAREFHERYRKGQLAKGQTPETNPSLVEWAELPESLKLSNRRQADAVYSLLKEAGFGIVPVNHLAKDATESFKQHIEGTAILEHERFVSERISDGWQDGERDAQKKTSPYLVPWDKLDENVKNIDREWAEELPEILKKVGYKICML